MRKKYRVSLMFIICGMVLCVFILLQYQAYLGRQEDSLGYTYVNDELSVNYLSGKRYQLGKDTLEFNKYFGKYRRGYISGDFYEQFF